MPSLALLRDPNSKALISALKFMPDLPVATGYGWSQLMECYPFVLQRHALASFMGNSYRLVSRVSNSSQELLLVALGSLQDLTAFFNLFCVPLSQSLTRSNTSAIKKTLGWWIRSIKFEAQSGLGEL